MDRLGRILVWITDHPAVSTAICALLTLVFAWHAPRVYIDASAEGLMVVNDPARQKYEEVKRTFGDDTVTIVLVKAPDVFSASVLGTIRRLTEAFAKIDGVTRVESLTTVGNIKGEGDTLNTGILVPADIPTAPEELQRIRADALRHRVFVDSLVSSKGTATAIYIFTDVSRVSPDFNRDFTGRVDALLREAAGPALTLYQIGGPITKVTLGQYMLDDLVTLTPIAGLVIGVILILAFRTMHGVIIPTVTGGASIVWALGLMAMFDLPINVVTAIVPALMVSIGFAEDVHMITAYQHFLEQGYGRREAVRAMAAEVALPITITTLTTVLGFGSLVTTDIRMLIQFGHASSLALLANYVLTVVLVPVMLLVLPVPRRLRAVGSDDETSEGWLPRQMSRLGDFVLRRRVAISLVSALLSLASLVGWYSLKVNTDFLSYFPEDTFIRRRAADFHESLAGGISFYVVVETGKEDGIKEPAVLQAIADIQHFLETRDKVDKTVALPDFLRTMHREMHGGDRAFEVIPQSRDLVAQYLLTLEGAELSRYVDFNASTANIVVNHHITSSWELSALLRELDAYLARQHAGLTVRTTGENILINNAADYMAINELTSFAYTFVVIGLIHGWLFRSVRAGFLSLIPNVVPILFNFGLMGLLGVPLNTGTAMIATIAIGIAVDDTVHVVVAFRRYLMRDGDPRAAVLNTLRSQGRPIVYVSLALAAGFLVMTFSMFVPTRQFGIYAAFVMVVAGLTELLLTPILLYAVPGSRGRGAHQPNATPGSDPRATGGGGGGQTRPMARR